MDQLETPTICDKNENNAMQNALRTTTLAVWVLDDWFDWLLATSASC